MLENYSKYCEEVKFDTTGDILPLLEGLKEIVKSEIQKDSNFYFHTLLLLGILNRTYELVESAIWSIDHDRPITAFSMLRALFETLGYICYSMKKLKESNNADEFSSNAANLLFASKRDSCQYQGVNILTCIDYANKMFPKLRQQYDEVSEIVHPNVDSHAYCGKTVKEEDRSVEFRLPAYAFKNNDKLAVTNMVGESCCAIQIMCKDILIRYQSIMKQKK